MGKLKNFWVACVRQPIHPWGVVSVLLVGGLAIRELPYVSYLLGPLLVAWGVGCGLGVYSFVRSLLAKRWRHALLQLVVAVVALGAVTFCAMFACMVKLTAR